MKFFHRLCFSQLLAAELLDPAFIRHRIEQRNPAA